MVNANTIHQSFIDNGESGILSVFMQCHEELRTGYELGLEESMKWAAAYMMYLLSEAGQSVAHDKYLELIDEPVCEMLWRAMGNPVSTALWYQIKTARGIEVALKGKKRED